MGRMEEYWECPNEFRPERWIGGKSSAFLPFGTGPRSCVGKDMAYLEAKVLVVLILQKYRLRLVNEKVEVSTAATLKFKNGVNVIVQNK